MGSKDWGRAALQQALATKSGRTVCLTVEGEQNNTSPWMENVPGATPTVIDNIHITTGKLEIESWDWELSLASSNELDCIGGLHILMQTLFTGLHNLHRRVWAFCVIAGNHFSYISSCFICQRERKLIGCYFCFGTQSHVSVMEGIRRKRKKLKVSDCSKVWRRDP